MSLDVSELSDYVDENRDGLIGRVVGGAKSIRILDLQTGFKSSGAINSLDTDVVLQDGSNCQRTPDGTTKLTQRILTVGEIKVEEDLCVKKLNKKYTQHQVKAGSKDEDIPFAKEYTSLKAKKIAQANELAIWQGDTTSLVVNLARFDGFIKIIDAEADVVDGNVGNVAVVNAANIIQVVEDMATSIPDQLTEEIDGEEDAGDLAVLLGADYFKMYKIALKNANLFHYKGEAMKMEIEIPAINVKAISLGGLTNTDRMFAGKIGSEGGFVVGTDLENEEESFDMWYSKDDKVMKFDAEYKLGTQIKFPEEIVKFALSV